MKVNRSRATEGFEALSRACLHTDTWDMSVCRCETNLCLTSGRAHGAAGAPSHKQDGV